MQTSTAANHEQDAFDIPDFSTEDRSSRALVRDLHTARAAIYWTDLLLTAALGWGAFALACRFAFFSAPMLLSSAVAVFALYRALCFMHELTHLRTKAVPWFEAVWNAIVGFPLLMPSFVYCGVHQCHHSLSTYGTKQDPEYMPFARSSRMTVIFAFESFLIPLALLLRFLVLAPVGMLIPPFHRWLAVHASSLTMNLEYRREATPMLLRTIRLQSAIVWAVWLGAIGLAAAGIIPWRAFGVWLLVSSFISFINTLRTLGAHAYESAGEPLDRQGQLLDSIDTPGAFWTELWAPVGLRYHALHHYFPGIPYHNLRAAHIRLAGTLPETAAYHRARSRNLPLSLSNLYRKGSRKSSNA